ncbi:hypothetical protein MRX96_002200 [Rhipicephalus microplus]
MNVPETNDNCDYWIEDTREASIPKAPRQISEEFMEPAKKVAEIIGRGGSGVRELQNSSSAWICIKKNDRENTYYETKVEISGGEEAL